MNAAPLLRQRLPCVPLLLAAVAGIALGRFAPAPGVAFALAVVILLPAAIRGRAALLGAVALAFAAAQAWQFRESNAATLAATLGAGPIPALATFEVLEAPRGSASRVRFLAGLERLEINGIVRTPACPVLVTWQGEPPEYGDRLRARVAVEAPRPPRNPGVFDYAAWLANRGVRTELTVLRPADATLLGRGGHLLMRAALASRGWIERTLALGIAGTEEEALIRGMTVGDTSEASDAMKDAFRETGTFHLFSVSGLHVGIVAALLWTFLGFLGVSQRRTVLLVIPALFFYALLTGLSAASLRAAVMLSILAAGLLLDRPAVPLNSIAAAGLLILGFDSSQLFNAGFQLSFGAVTAIILLAMPIQRRLEGRFAPDPFLPAQLISPFHRVGFRFVQGGAAVLAVSCAAWLATLPLNVLYFHFVSLTALPANLVAVPLSTVILALASVALLAGLVSPWLAEVFNHANLLVTKAVLVTVQSLAAVPGSAVYLGPPLPAELTLRVVALDASPGAATAAFTHSATWLVDTGNEFFATTNTVPFLRSRGVNQLAGLALTHGDVRHLGGAARIIETFHPRVILDSGLPDRSPNRRRLLAAFPTQSAPAGWVQSVAKDVWIEVLYPPANASGVYADDKGVVLRLATANFSALLTADAGAATEHWLLAHARERLRSDLVIMGRHVSSPSGDPDFLRAVAPRAIITTAAAFPEGERLDPAWLAAVRALGIDVFRQDETGAVTVDARRDGFTLTPFLAPAAAQTYPLQ